VALDSDLEIDMVKCETPDCREDLIDKIDVRLRISTAWKATTFVVMILFFVWGVVFSLYGAGLSDRKEAIKENKALAVENKTDIRVIKNDLDYLKQGQRSMNLKIDRLLNEITKDKDGDHESPRVR